MNAKRRTRRNRRAFSLVEMLIALAISSMLMTATLGALDASWRSYKVTTESASTHVVSRIVVSRMLSLIRTGTEFGPYPADFLDPAQNPVPDAGYIEFLAEADRLQGNEVVTRIERRESQDQQGMFELWYVRLDVSGAEPAILDQRPLLRGVQEATFILEYEPGPRLKRATIDLAIQPDDDRDIKMGVGSPAPMIRLVASAVPKQLND
jgi:prepilin-type N-terminal cleavage/methylation domain-containing protein